MYLSCFEELSVIYPMIYNPHFLNFLETATSWSGTTALFPPCAYLTSFTIPSVCVCRHVFTSSVCLSLMA
jgi:hypothetical protein